MDSTGLVQGPMVGCCEDDRLSVFRKYGDYFSNMNDSQFFK
jgi:hypothetical protein